MSFHNQRTTYLPFISFDYCRDFLFNHYTENNIKDPSREAYRNSTRLSYYLRHGETYFEQSGEVPLSLQPLLLFYGATQLMKAVLLISDPEYPATSKMLSHGLSTRKRKKQHFHYLNDSVKVQKDGLFSCVSTKMFHMKPFQGKVLVIRDLILSLPSLHPMMTSLYGQKKESSSLLPELLTYYALLYHLSMISRYETEWWYEEGINGSAREKVLLTEVLYQSRLQIPKHIADYLQ